MIHFSSYLYGSYRPSSMNPHINSHNNQLRNFTLGLRTVGKWKNAKKMLQNPTSQQLKLKLI